MVLLVAVVIGVAVGFLTGGSLAGFQHARFRLLWLILLAVITQVLIFTRPVGTLEIVHDYGEYFYMASLVATLIFLVCNLHVPGLWVILIGAALNAVVIFANGGYMPSPESALERAGRMDHVRQDAADVAAGKRIPHTNSVIADDDTWLGFLGDVLVIPEGYPGANVLSIGDLFIALGAGATTALVMRRRPDDTELGDEEPNGRRDSLPLPRASARREQSEAPES
jgi:hypothetical protein